MSRADQSKALRDLQLRNRQPRQDECEEPIDDYVQRTLPPRDRLAGVYFAATKHDEDQPATWW